MKKNDQMDELLKKVFLSEKTVDWWKKEMKALTNQIEEEEKKALTGPIDEEKLEKLRLKCDYLLNKGKFEISQIDKILIEVDKYVKKKKE